MYSTGHFQDVCDFDPGLGVYTYTSQGGFDIYVSKLDNNGNFVWARQISGTSNESAYAIDLDASGNIYITGKFQGVVDFDPGPGTFTLSGNGIDIFVCKLNSSGDFVWAKRIGGGGQDEGLNLRLDVTGNVLITGFFNLTVDFDPGPGTFNITSVFSEDAFMLKLDANGNFIWAKTVGGMASERSRSICGDIQGNVISTGIFNTTVDFDPGPGSFTMNPTSSQDAFVLKLDAAGNFVWAIHYAGDVSSVVTDQMSNVYLGGAFSGTVDFDPGPQTYTMSRFGVGNTDAYILKLKQNSIFSWAKQLGGTALDIVNALTVDLNGNVYSTGDFSGTADLDPGPLTYTFFAGNEIFISKLDSLGNFITAVSLGGNGLDHPTSIDVTATGEMITTGFFNSAPADFDPGPGTFTLDASFGDIDAFVSKLSSCTPAPPANITSTTNLNICEGNSTTLTVASNPTVTWYPTQSSTVVIGSGTVFLTPTLSTGTYTYYAQSANLCTISLVRTPVVVDVSPIPTITVNSGTVCLGSSFTVVPTGAATYTYIGGGPVITPSINTTYSVIGTSSAGCLSIPFATGIVSVVPLPSITVNSGSICSGNVFTIVPTGANTYSYSVGGPVFTPSSTTSYSVVGTSSLGCNSNSVVGTVSVLLSPSLSVQMSSTLICLGQCATLSVNGADTYTWLQGGNTNSIVVNPIQSTNYTVQASSLNGCSVTAVLSLSVDPCTVFNEKVKENINCFIYPNPSSGLLQIHSSEKIIGMKLIDCTGRELEIREVNGKVNIDILEEGVYFLKVYFSDSQRHFRFIKKAD